MANWRCHFRTGGAISSRRSGASSYQPRTAWYRLWPTPNQGGAVAVSQLVERRESEHKFFFAVAVLFPLLVLAGFGRTYYLKGWFATPPVSALVHLHGALMTLWVVLFMTQVWLISARRI